MTLWFICVNLIKNDLQEILLLIPRSPSTARTFRTWKEKNRKRKYQFICGSVLTYYCRAGGLGGGGYWWQLPPHFLPVQNRKDSRNKFYLANSRSQFFVAFLENQNFTIVPQQNFRTFRYPYIAHFFYNNNHDIEGLFGYGYSMTSQWDQNFDEV